MTEEFKRRMDKANDKALAKYIQAYENEFIKKYQHNKKYADLYQDLIISLVETYDYAQIGIGLGGLDAGFNFKAINKDYSEIIGQPEKIVTEIDPENERRVIIKLFYKKVNDYKHIGIPNYIREGTADFTMIWEILRENDIIIFLNRKDFSLELHFDASIIYITYTTLEEKTKRIKKRIITNNK